MNQSSRQRVAGAMAKGGRFEVVRERETIEDLVKGQRPAGFP